MPRYCKKCADLVLAEHNLQHVEAKLNKQMGIGVLVTRHLAFPLDRRRCTYLRRSDDVRFSKHTEQMRWADGVRVLNLCGGLHLAEAHAFLHSAVHVSSIHTTSRGEKAYEWMYLSSSGSATAMLCVIPVQIWPRTFSSFSMSCQRPILR